MSKTLEDIVDKALENINGDRQKVLDAYQEMKDVLRSDNIDAVELAGNTTVKLLETLIKANDQVVKLAQIKEREEGRTKAKKDDRTPMDIEEIKRAFEEAGH